VFLEIFPFLLDYLTCWNTVFHSILLQVSFVFFDFDGRMEEETTPPEINSQKEWCILFAYIWGKLTSYQKDELYPTEVPTGPLE
jgi:hypothetical protein